MNPQYSKSIRESVPLDQGFRMALHFHSILEINEVCIRVWYPDKEFSICRVSNGFKFTMLFRKPFHPKPDRGNGFYHKKIPDNCKWAWFTNKNPAFQVDNFGSN
jgi:hypothetical protein